ncbi:transcription antitermination factor NusB [Fulvivirga sp. M361]|uniref:transcription antitermination factor NusB n=1 Tax=Fulvivirga sp. M361 TaxID=2594266 RepID=UPI0011799B6F|nr:transcription antitermination factor NusB [Fulvivirga sp. M361]TRX48900.1 transcription antitermination factor NusB [Fulvivirga sp. M361]
MLNRRTLRIKAMQTLFALRQSREANFELAKAFIDDSFLPDLNSMEVQDKELLKTQNKEALQLFRKNYSNAEFKSETSSDGKIDKAVNTAIEQYHKNNENDIRSYKKSMLADSEKIYDRYLLALNLLLEFHAVAENDTKRDHKHFVKNLLIKAIKSNSTLENSSLRKNLQWQQYQSEIRQWFKEVRSDETYQEYICKDNPSFEDDKEILLHIVKNIIFKSDVIDKFMEEDNLNWEEDRAIIKSLVTKTIKELSPECKADFELQQLSYNWEDDKMFFKKLFENTIQVESEYQELIASKTKNWEIDRIAATDRVILDMAIGEMINFPSIPVKVTINEYIEVAKKYSTPKSKLFINGVLDVIAEELSGSGVIRKSGRGLIDNK